MESSLYYLNSRYYNPELGRFINADVFTGTLQGVTSYNMFTYCLNDPINMNDSNGRVPSEYSSNPAQWYFQEQERVYAETKLINQYGGKRFGSVGNKPVYVFDGKKVDDDNKAKIAQILYNAYLFFDKTSYKKSPEIMVYNSHKIHNSFERHRVIKKVLEYNNTLSPDDSLNRSKAGMHLEWFCHNAGAILPIWDDKNLYRLQYVDFDKDSWWKYDLIAAVTSGFGELNKNDYLYRSYLQ